MNKAVFTFLFIASTFYAFAQELGSDDLIGTKVQAFELTDINGNTISSESTKGKVVVLNFWFVGCKPCIEEIPELNKVYETYSNKPDIVFASIALDKVKRVQKYLDKYNIEYPIVADGKTIAESFAVYSYPTNIVIDKEGNYHFRFAGGFSGIGEFIAKSIQKAL